MSSQSTYPAPDSYKDTIDLPVHWVKTINELYQLIEEIDNSDIVALDTEFIRKGTYHPILALIQINTGQAIYLVDAPRLNLDDLWQALIEIPQMVWYACAEDLSIFYLLSNCPPLTNVIDVQISIAYLTGNLATGFARAVSDLLSVQLNKTESQSNWLLRPLSYEQECYAIDDVRYLLALHEISKHHLQQKNLWHMVIDDSNGYALELHQRQHANADTLYLNYLKYGYNREQITVLQAILAWRENLAHAINRPCTSIINKQALREIIEKLPKNIRQLSATSINGGIVRLYGKEILKTIEKAQQSDEQPFIPAITFYHKNNIALKEIIQKEIERHSQQSGIPASVLLKNRWIDALFQMVLAHDSNQLDEAVFASLPYELQGHRLAWIKQAILPILYNHRASIQQENSTA